MPGLRLPLKRHGSLFFPTETVMSAAFPALLGLTGLNNRSVSDWDEGS
jgi:hypothetical protein